MDIQAWLGTTLQQNADMVRGYLADLDGEELVRPLPNGQHAAWLVSHMLVVEDGAISELVLGRPGVLERRWHDVAHPGTRPLPEASRYPDKQTLLRMLESVRANTIAAIQQTSVADWDRPTKPGVPEFLGTVGRVFLRAPVHLAFHTGQLAAVRRMLGRKPLFF